MRSIIFIFILAVLLNPHIVFTQEVYKNILSSKKSILNEGYDLKVPKDETQNTFAYQRVDKYGSCWVEYTYNNKGVLKVIFLYDDSQIPYEIISDIYKKLPKIYLDLVEKDSNNFLKIKTNNTLFSKEWAIYSVNTAYRGNATVLQMIMMY